jgi:hypothetical protein
MSAPCRACDSVPGHGGSCEDPVDHRQTAGSGWPASASFAVVDSLPQPTNMEYQKRSKNGNADWLYQVIPARLLLVREGLSHFHPRSARVHRL